MRQQRHGIHCCRDFTSSS